MLYDNYFSRFGWQKKYFVVMEMALNKTVKLESLLKILRLLDKRVALTPAQLAELLGVTAMDT